MKKFAILTITVLGFGYSGMNMVSGQQASVQSTPVQSNFSTGGLFHVIDDIEVPHEVLEYIQLTYDGHAVIKAEKITRDGQELYKLRVDRDDLINDANGISVLFDMNWKLVGTEKATAPPPTPEPVKPINIENPAEPSTEETQNTDNLEEETRPVGGSGAQPVPAEATQGVNNNAEESDNENMTEQQTNN